MDNEQIISVCEFYRRELKELYSPDPELHHVEDMTYKIPKFLEEGKEEKANRWLGFIQATLCAKGLYTIEDLKDHNRPGP